VNYDFFSGGVGRRAIEKWKLKGKFVVVQSGMMTEIKNQLKSVRIVNEVKDKIPNVLLILAGTWDEGYKKRLDDFIKKEKLEKHVLFTGNLERKELRDLYKASDVGLFPVGGQGGWLAPFELLCSGNPVIVSSELGAASVIKKFDLGVVSDDYSGALLEVYSRLKEFKRDGNRRKKVIQKNLGWDVFSDKMIEGFRRAWKKD